MSIPADLSGEPVLPRLLCIPSKRRLQAGGQSGGAKASSGLPE
jgi:hypothetical protein